MEDVKQAKDNERIWWRKIGGGTFRMANGKIIKPNQKFKARPEEIPESFRDVVKPLGKLPEETVETISPGYELRYKGSGWYDVVDGQGKIMNEKSLRENEARKLLESLM